MTRDPAAPARCGQVALLGRPNVGKSTLLNRLLGERLSIVTHKPQTTRSNILGVLTRPAGQILFVDTPGIHRDARRALNRYMNRAATGSIAGVDALACVFDATRLTDDDTRVFELRERFDGPAVGVVNKIDRVPDKNELLPVLDTISRRGRFDALLPVSARTGSGVDRLPEELIGFLPEMPALFDADTFTTASKAFLAGELVREQLLRLTHQEIPYRCAVMVEQFEERRAGVFNIAAVIWVERRGQKAAIIGRKGAMLKRIGSRARASMERLFHARVHLDLWVKCRSGWSDDERRLHQLGLDAV